MKLTYEQKLKAYQDWKSIFKSPGTIARELHVGETVLRYFLRLADRHGTETLKHSDNKYYSLEETILRKLDNETVLFAKCSEASFLSISKKDINIIQKRIVNNNGQLEIYY